MARHGPSFSLHELLTISDGFLAFAMALNRPMTKAEKTPHLWILREWESARIKFQCANAKEDRLRAIILTMERLRQIFCPDPIKQDRRKRKIDNLTPTLSPGNNKTAVEAMFGVEEREMSEMEAADRLVLMVRMIKGIRYLMKELSSYHGRRRKIVFGSWLRKFNHIAATLVEKLEYADTVGPDEPPRRAVEEPPDPIEEE